MVTRAAAAFFALSLFPCLKPAAPVDAGAVERPASVTLLFTGAENGYLLPAPDETGALRGGAAQVLGRWVAHDGHPNSTLVLSTGDNANGAAISTFFAGASTAELMKHMGYAASAFGNHELDQTREQFITNQRTSGITYLAANLEAVDDGARALGLRPWAIFERQGVKIGVIGLSNRRAPSTVLKGRFDGLTLLETEGALAKAVPEVWQQGANAVVVVMDGCLDEVAASLARHTDWALAAVAGRRCGNDSIPRIGSTHLIYPGSRLAQYVRLTLGLDLSKAARSQVRSAVTTTVQVEASPGAPAPDAHALALLEPWQRKLNDALGEQIGFSKAGIEQTEAKMLAWVGEALRAKVKAQVALVNKKGVRQSLPPGPITKASVYSVIPFEDTVVKVQLSPAQLKAVTENPAAVVVGLTPQMLSSAQPVTMATSDYLYFGGDGFTLEQFDPAAELTGVDWRLALIDFTKMKNSTEKKPLEAALP